MPRFPNEFIDTLFDRVDIVDVISDYVTLKQTGNRYVGLCPFHREKTPSFSVDGDKQLFYCFGCHTGGNVFTFLTKIENVEFADAVQMLAERANIPLPEQPGGGPSISRETKMRLFEANRAAARFYFDQLYQPLGSEGLQYLHNRGIDDPVIRRFGLGFAPNEWDALVEHLRGQNFRDEEMLSAGLAQMGDRGLRDNFRNRIMFPIIVPTGEVIAFGGRVMDSSQPKYLNTSDTPVFNKRKNLYALNLLKKKANNKNAIIVEGYMDVIALNKHGFDFAVASLGTAVTREQIKLLHRNATSITLAYDGDHAGIDATHKAINIMIAEKIKPKVIALPPGVDPDEYIRDKGRDAFGELLDKAVPALEYLLQEAKAASDMTDEQGRAAYALAGAGIVAKYSLDSIETEMYLKRISRDTGFTMEALYRSIGQSHSEAALQLARASAQGQAPAAKIEAKSGDILERSFLALLVKHPELVSRGAELVEPEHFGSIPMRDIFVLLQRGGAEGKSLKIQELLLQCGEDSEKSSAASAVCIEDIDFVEPMQYLQECAGRIRISHEERKRKELKDELDRLSKDPAATQEEIIRLVKEISQTDNMIRELKTKR